MESSKLIATHFLLVLLFVTKNLFANESIFEFAQIRLQGNGCPQGTYSLVASPDNQTLTILFDQLMAEVPNHQGMAVGNRGTDTKLDYKVCDIVIEADIPVGQKLEGIDFMVQARGSLSADIGTESMFKSMLQELTAPVTPGRSRPEVLAHKEWKPRYDFMFEDWFIDETRRVAANSGCAARHTRRTKLILKNILHSRILPGAPADTSALLTFDSADLGSSMKVFFQTKRCGPPTVQGGRGPSVRMRPTPGRGPGVGRGPTHPGQGRGTGPRVCRGLACR